jgi:hypothetical protein
MSRMFNRKSAVVVGVLFLLSAAGAYAYFTQTGSGSGTATTGSAAGITVVQTSTPSGLTPGSAPQALSGNFTNPGGAVHVATVTAALGSVTNALGDPIDGCTTSDYQINSAHPTINLTIAGGTGVGAWSGPTLQMLDSGANQDACKGAIVHVTYSSD